MNDFGVHRSFLMPIFEVPINLAMGVQYRYGEFDITADDACLYYRTGLQGSVGPEPAIEQLGYNGGDYIPAGH